MMPSVSKIYIIHYTKLAARKEHMLSEIEKWKLDTVPVFFEERMDQEDLTDFDIYNIINTAKFRQNTNRDIKRGEASLCLKFRLTLENISKLNDDEYVLILEDDVIFKQEPFQYINNLIERCEKEDILFDCIFLGEGGLRIGDNREVFFKKDHPATNGTCTMLYKVSAAKKILQNIDLFKIENSLDWHLNKVFKDLNLNIYWGKAITEHGSVTAVHDKSKSSLKSCLRDKY